MRVNAVGLDALVSEFSPMKKRPINPRLISKLKKKRAIATQLEAFSRCARAIEGFEKAVQLRAINAVLAIIS